MAGFDNEVMFALGERLQQSTPQAIQLMKQTATDVSNINFTGNPNGAVSANPGSFCHDPVSGNVYIKVSGTGSTVWAPISTGTSSITWNVVTSATNPNSLLTNNGYIPKGGTVVVFVLPASAAVGDMFRIAGYGNLWTLTQNASQTIFMGNQTTTAGVGGSLTATQIKDTVELVCVTDNTEFHVLSSMGNITVT